MKKWIVLDWETRSSCDLKKAGSYKYAADPTTEILCVTLGNTGGRTTWHPGLPIPPIVYKAIAEGWTWVAHKTDFERSIWKSVATPDHSWPMCPPLELWHDTQSRAYQLALPGALENVLRVLDMGIQKDMEGSKLTIGLSKPDKKGRMPTVTPEILARVCAYCETDIDGEVGLVKRLGWLPECEREPWVLSQEMNDRGIRLDLPLVEAMQTVVDRAIPPLAAEFKAITGLRPTQLQKFKGWLLEQGLDLPNLRKETVAEALEEEDEAESDAEDETAPPEEAALPVDLAAHVRRSLEIKALVGSSSIKKLGAMKEVVGYDGRARGLITYHRTTPGRGGGTLLQPHNFPKPSLKIDGKPLPISQIHSLKRAIMACDPELLEMMYGVGAVEVVVSALRHCLIPEPGHRFMSGDYSGIQARVVLALAGQHDKTALMAAGLDAYIDMACDIWPELTRPDWSVKAAVDAWKERYPKQRGTGKNSVLGLGFQMGDRTFQIKYAKEHPLEFCTMVVQAYRKKWAPKVPELWYGIQDASIDTVRFGNPHTFAGITYRLEDRWLTAEIPNGKGSKLWYYNPRAFRKAMWWDETDIRWAFKYDVMKNGHWVTRDAFGGQLVENLVMKIEREIMEDAKRRLKRYGYQVCLEVHDELLSEVAHSTGSLDEYKEMLEDVEPWVHDLRIPIQVDCWEGGEYRK